MTIRPIRIAVAAFFISTFLVSSAFADENLADLKSIVNGNNLFALQLYTKLKAEKGNLFFSPYSISSALAMTYSGARGDTAKEMTNTLHFIPGAEKTNQAFAGINAKLDEIQKQGNFKLLIANSLWPQKDYHFLPGYLSVMDRYYGASIFPVDFMHASEETRTRINDWVEDRTQGKIRDVIQNPLPFGTSLVLVNAIYFKGNWEQQFDPKRTVKADFSLLSSAKTQVSMMRLGGRFGYHEFSGAKLLELPYAGKQLSMIFILPNEALQLSKLEDELTSANLQSWLSGIKEQFVEVNLPKFKVIRGTHDLIQPLTTLGMKKAFQAGAADFSGIDGTKHLSIGLLLHKAFVEINEEGTEAAASTAAAMTLTGVPRSFTFRADHPFLFVIRDNITGSILFIGRILDPNSRQT
jgi:serine protease inhibitor